jgi:hypothetical protein
MTLKKMNTVSSLLYLMDKTLQSAPKERTDHGSREPLLKGKAWYSWPPSLLTSLDQLLFYINILLTFFETSYLNEEVNCTERSPSVSVT